MAAYGLVNGYEEFQASTKARVEETKARAIETNGLAWQILSTQAPGNSGKIWALNHLALGGHALNGIDLSCEAMGGNPTYETRGEGEDEKRILTDCRSRTYLHRVFQKVKAEKGGDYRISLIGVNLAGADLWEANLQRANLKDADLQGVVLRDANLQGANLWGVNLQGVVLRDANLQGANLRHANLQGVVLWGANLQGANLRHANLQGANLRHANLQGANLRHANLQGANLRHANLQGAVLWGANLQGAFLWNADLRGANLRDASLQGVQVSNVDFTNHKGQPLPVQVWAWADMVPKELPKNLQLMHCTFDEGKINYSPVEGEEEYHRIMRTPPRDCIKKYPWWNG